MFALFQFQFLIRIVVILLLSVQCLVLFQIRFRSEFKVLESRICLLCFATDYLCYSLDLLREQYQSILNSAT